MVSLAILIPAIIAVLALVILFSVLYVKHRNKLNKELQEKLSYFQKQIKSFFEEYFELQKKYISEESENAIISKWESFYSEVKKFHVPKKNDSAEIGHFKETYSNLHKEIADINAEIKRKESVKELSESVSNFFSELFKQTEQYVSHKTSETFISKWAYIFQEAKITDVRKTDDEYEDIERFKTVYSSLTEYFDSANNQFIQNESVKFDSLLSNIDGKSLDEQQRTAVINDEDRILVLAGAGSGKTLTISAKVKYLYDIKKVNPKEILLISFTKKSAQEMTERIQNKLNIPVDATTFHKLGLDIIKKANDFRPEIADENSLVQFVHNFFENEVVNHPDLVKALTEYFAYFLEIPDDL